MRALLCRLFGLSIVFTPVPVAAQVHDDATGEEIAPIVEVAAPPTRTFLPEAIPESGAGPRIVFDDTKDLDGDELTGNYAEFAKFLTGNRIGATLVELNQGPITPGRLAGGDIFVVNDIEVAYTSAEIDAIRGFVRSGGALLVIGEWSFAHDMASVNALTAEFGIFQEGMYTGTSSCRPAAPLGTTPRPTGTLTFDAPGALRVSGPASTQCVMSNGGAAIAISDVGGRLAVVSDSDLFAPSEKFLARPAHARFLENSVAYLTGGGRIRRVEAREAFASCFAALRCTTSPNSSRCTCSRINMSARRLTTKLLSFGTV